MLRRNMDELIAYVAQHPDRAALVLRGSPDLSTAFGALRQAAAAVWEIPDPYHPDAPLPHWSSALIEDGEAVLRLDLQDNGEHAARVVEVILARLDAAGLDGRLEPGEFSSGS